MKLLKSFRLKAEAELECVSRYLAEIIKPAMVLGLEGELGSGKTTLVKSLFKLLQVQEMVASPSYVLESIYKGVLPDYNPFSANKKVTLHHWDLYRLPGAQSGEEILGSMLAEQHSISFVEWSSRLDRKSDLLSLLIKLKFLDENSYESAQGENNQGREILVYLVN